MLPRVLGELMEVERIVDVGEVVVKEQVGEDRLLQVFHFGFEKGTEPVGPSLPGRQELQEGDGLRDLLAGVLDGADVELHHLALDTPGVAAGQGVVTDVGHALRRQVAPADRRQPIAHRRRHP